MELLPTSFSDCCQESPCCTTGTPVSCGQICVGDGPAIYDTLAQLKAAPTSVFPLSVPKEFIIRGLDAIYDGGYRIYISDPSNGDTPDDYQTVQATNFSGRLKLIFG